MKTTDKQFYMAFTVVLVALVAITVFVAFVANIAGSREMSDKTANKLLQAKERIEPVGKVNLASAPSADVNSVSVPVSSTTVAVAQSGEQVYNGICQSCHTIGLLDSPKLGDKAAWKARLVTGTNAIYASAINGKGLMPAKGGNPALSDADVKAAVDFMLEKVK